MLLETLGASLLGNMLAGKGIVRAGYGYREGKGMLRASYGSKKKILIQPHPLRKFEIKNVVKINQDLMESFQEVIYLRK